MLKNLLSDITVIIPIKELSLRVSNKNIKTFCNNQSLLDIKIKQLLRLFKPKQIIIFTDTPVLCEKIKNSYKNIYVVTSKDHQLELYAHIREIATYVETKYLMRAVVTLPFFSEDFILQALKSFKAKNNSIIVGEEIAGHILDYKLNPVNFTPGNLHPGSQDVPPVYYIKSIFLLETKLAKKFEWNKMKPQIFNLSLPYCLDINYPCDWDLARFFYKNFKKYINEE